MAWTLERDRATGNYVVTARPDDVARWLIWERKDHGAASGGIDFLAERAAKRRRPSLNDVYPPPRIKLTLLPPEGKSGWGWDKPVDIMQNRTYGGWVVDGYRIHASAPCADLPLSIGLSELDRGELRERRRLPRRTPKPRARLTR